MILFEYTVNNIKCIIRRIKVYSQFSNSATILKTLQVPFQEYLRNRRQGQDKGHDKVYIYIHIRVYVVILQAHVLIYKHDSTLCSHPSSAPPPPNILEGFKDIESGDFSKSCKQNAYWCAICVPLLQILRSKHNLENVSAILQRFFAKLRMLVRKNCKYDLIIIIVIFVHSYKFSWQKILQF